MKLRTLAARGLSFAHLAGFAARGSRAEDDNNDDEPKKNDAEDDQDKPKDDDQSGSKGKKGRRAEDDDSGDGDDQNRDDSDSKRGKAKGSDDDDDTDAEDDELDAEDDEDEMRGKSASARARRRERARCAAIFASKAAARNPEMAANLAFNTSLTRQEALALLRSAPAQGADNGSRSRAARNPNLGAGGDMQRGGAQQVQAGWDRSFQKVTGKRG